MRWFEGQGYTTEAARAAAAWARRQPGVTRVRATIPSWHAASLRGAARLGMRQTGTSHDDVGEVLVLELSRADAALASRWASPVGRAGETPALPGYDWC